MRIFTICIMCLMACAASAQMVREPIAVKYASMGAYSANFSDVFSGTANQAALAGLKVPAMAMYGERRFMLSELSNYSAIIATPLATSGTIAFQGDYFGSADFNESQIGLAYARKVSAKIDVGAKFNYHSVRVNGYGTSSAINVELGAILHLSEKVHAGFHLYNPTGSKLSKSGGEKLASVYRFGLGYEASKNVLLSTEIVKQENRDININAGLQYNIHDKLLLRAGISTLSSNNFVGLGVRLNFGRIDINAAYHPQLGFTPGVLLIINLKKQ